MLLMYSVPWNSQMRLWLRKRITPLISIRLDKGSQMELNRRVIFGLLLTALSFRLGEASFSVYWNVPTEQCRKYGLRFNLSTYHIIQNTGDTFQDGDRINIIYMPGKFPYFNDTQPVSGGIPQEADLFEHMRTFRSQVDKFIPMKFQGYVVLDFEKYQPSYAISPKIYKQASRAWAKENYPKLPPAALEKKAEESFNEDSRTLFTILLNLGKVLRPEARWGYYHYPYCKNWLTDKECRLQQTEVNEEIDWFFESSGVLLPSVYLNNPYSNPYLTREWVKLRLMNAKRIRGSLQTPILSYNWLKFRNTKEKFLRSTDLWNTLGVAWYLRLEGAVIWGGSRDVKSKQHCVKLKKYVKRTLGPIVRLLTKYSPEEVPVLHHLFKIWFGRDHTN